MRFFAFLLLAAAFALPGAAPSRAQDFLPGKYEEKLKSYDATAVAAAQNYAKNLNMRGMIEKSVPYLVQGIAQKVKAGNPDLQQDQIKAFVDFFLQNLLEDQGGTVERASILTLLETMTKDELVALNAFYATPVGGSILKKMPLLVGRMGENMQLMRSYLIPQALESAKAEMKKNGVEVKL